MSAADALWQLTLLVVLPLSALLVLYAVGRFGMGRRVEDPDELFGFTGAIDILEAIVHVAFLLAAGLLMLLFDRRRRRPVPP